MPQYESYKPGPVEWPGEIPAHWDVKKNKFLWREKEDRSLSGGEQLLSVSQHSGVVPRAEESRSESLEDYKRCEPNDLVINIMLAWMSCLGVSKYSGIVSPAYRVYRRVEDHNPMYFDYLYHTPQYIAEFARRSKGVVASRWRMYSEDFGQVVSILPPRDEQDRIVAFLDHHTAAIDAAIAKKERLIELLHEQKSVLIKQAVSRGLHPGSPTRDSGVPWLGRIPSHWQVLPLKRIAKTVKTGKTPPSDSEFDGFKDGSILWFSPGDFVDDGVFESSARLVNRRAVQNGHVDMFAANSIYFIGIGATLGKACVSRVPASCNQQVNVISLADDCDPDFFACQLNSIRHDVFGLAEFPTVPILNQAETKRIKIAIPPYAEQREISGYVKSVVELYKHAINTQKKLMSTLRELRTNMIAEVVMGSFRV